MVGFKSETPMPAAARLLPGMYQYTRYELYIHTIHTIH